LIKFDKSKKITVIFLSAILFLSIPIPMADAIGFSTERQNISNDSDKSRIPDVATSGNNVYVIWRSIDGLESEIYFSKSVDAGNTFDNPDNLSSSVSITSNSPQISANENNVFTVWEEGSDIVFKRSNDSGNLFESVINLSNSGTVSQDAQVSSTTSNVFVTFREGTDVFLSSSTNSGISFDSPSNLSNSGTNSITPQVSTSGNDAFVVWKEGDDISFVKASETGGIISLDSVIPLSNSGNTPVSQKPQIASSGDNVFVVWHEGTNIVVSNSTDAGSNFSNYLDIGDTGGASAPNPQITMSGNNVHVVWRDDTLGKGEVMYSKSIEGGAFTLPINLSDNVGSSIKPQIASSGSNVYVTWRDNSSGNNEIIFIGSDDNGENFSTKTTISPTESSDNSDNPQIAISGNIGQIVWEEDTSNPDVFAATATSTETSISFSPTGELKLGDTATITVTNSGESGTINVNVTSSADPAGFNLSLDEIATETHSGTLSFSEILDSSQADRRLKANPGDTISVTFGATQADAQIFSRTVTFTAPGEDLTKPNSCLDEITSLKVDDPNSNTDSGNIDTVTVDLTSDVSPSGISLVLYETGNDTGIFGGSTSSKEPQLVFYTNYGLVPQGSSLSILQDDSLKIPETEGSLNTNSSEIDVIQKYVTSTSEIDIVELTLLETGTNSSLFSGTLTLTNGLSDNATNTLHTSGGDIFEIIPTEETHGLLALVTPIEDYQNAIKVNFDGIEPPTVVAKLGSESDETTVRVSCGAGRRTSSSKPCS
jgi:hypothetical protein